MHKGIKRYQIKSVILDDSKIVSQRQMQQHLLQDQMQSEGYVPVLDLGPFWSTRLNSEDNYEAVFTMYAVFVGRKKACLIEGVDGAGKFYPRPVTQKAK